MSDATTRTHLDALEAEAIHVMREAAAQFERVALLFSGGKDSTVLAHVARRTFHPARSPFPLLHVDTGHNFPETLAFRDALAESLGMPLAVRTVADSITLDLAPGRHVLRCRATDASGATQPDVACWNALGYGNNAVRTSVVSAEDPCP